MKRKSSRTLKIGRISMTIFPNEVMVFFASDKNLYFKKFRRSFFTPTKKKALVLLSLISLITVIFLLNQDPLPDAGSKDSAYEDDRIKNDLLLSSNTDYSSPEETQKVIVNEHIVLDGENLSMIAEKYGVSIDTICGSNNLKSYDFILTGAHLKIPSKEGILYRMRDGNNVAEVAKLFNVSLEKIISENDIENPDFIPVDMVIFVPDAKPQNIIRGFMWPTQNRFITCGYGWRRNPYDTRYREFHQGLDIRASYDWVRSAKYGKVTYTGWLGGYGKTVIIAHPGGWKTVYAHLSRYIVRSGQYIKQGQIVGKSGNTGRSTGPHLHFEVMKSGSHKNPYPYLKNNTRL